MGFSHDAVVRIWRLGKPFQRRFIWLVAAKFNCGVTGVVRTPDGRLLLLRHRFWAPGQQWGFPSGMAKKRERHQDTIVREVHEETGLTVTVGSLLDVRSGFRYHIEVYYEAFLAADALSPSGELEGLVLDPREILRAGLFTADALPDDMPPHHRALATRAA
jgi:8-oxo-dGTP pyrophosphatase MutT (NUDIX family)